MIPRWGTAPLKEILVSVLGRYDSTRLLGDWILVFVGEETRAFIFLLRVVTAMVLIFRSALLSYLLGETGLSRSAVMVDSSTGVAAVSMLRIA